MAGAATRANPAPMAAAAIATARGLNQHLLDQPRPAGANRQAQGHLPLAGGAAREHQVRQVGARGQQYEDHDRGQDPQRPLVVETQTRDAVGRGPHDEARAKEALPLGAGRIVRHPHTLAAKIRQRGLHRPADLVGTMAGRESPHHFEPVPPGIRQRRLLRRGGERHPQARADSRLDAREAFARDADDLVCGAFQGEHAADNVRIPAEPTAPEAVAEHGDGAATSQIVVGRNNHAPESRRHPEHAKTISGDELSVHSFLSACRVECGHARRLVAESGQLGAPPHRIDETGEERIVERSALRAAAFEHADRDQRRRLADGQRPKDQGIDQRERRRAAADRQCQRGDRGQ